MRRGQCALSPPDCVGRRGRSRFPALRSSSDAAQPAPATAAAAAPSNSTTASPTCRHAPTRRRRERGRGGLARQSQPPPPPPVEYPGWARRDPWTVGSLDPADAGLGDDAVGRRERRVPVDADAADADAARVALGAYRASRRVARQGRTRRVNVNPVDWVAERAWLLLRLGEADAARMLVSGVDADRFTPKMVQVAVQSALANADPPALCPLEDGIQQIRRRRPAARPGDVRFACRRARSRVGA